MAAAAQIPELWLEETGHPSRSLMPVCLSHPLPSMGIALPPSLLSFPSPSYWKVLEKALPVSRSRRSAPCPRPHAHTPSPPHLSVSLLPRGVSIPPFLPRPGPRLLIVQTQFSSLWLWPRVESGRPEPPPPNLEGRAGRRV